jgi:hypothetical protein
VSTKQAKKGAKTNVINKMGNYLPAGLLGVIGVTGGGTDVPAALEEAPNVTEAEVAFPEEGDEVDEGAEEEDGGEGEDGREDGEEGKDGRERLEIVEGAEGSEGDDSRENEEEQEEEEEEEERENGPEDGDDINFQDEKDQIEESVGSVGSVESADSEVSEQLDDEALEKQRIENQAAIEAQQMFADIALVLDHHAETTAALEDLKVELEALHNASVGLITQKDELISELILKNQELMQSANNLSTLSNSQ